LALFEHPKTKEPEDLNLPALLLKLLLFNRQLITE